MAFTWEQFYEFPCSNNFWVFEHYTYEIIATSPVAQWFLCTNWLKALPLLSVLFYVHHNLIYLTGGAQDSMLPVRAKMNHGHSAACVISQRYTSFHHQFSTKLKKMVIVLDHTENYYAASNCHNIFWRRDILGVKPCIWHEIMGSPKLIIPDHSFLAAMKSTDIHHAYDLDKFQDITNKTKMQHTIL